MADDELAAMVARTRVPNPLIRVGEELPEGALAVVAYHPSAASRCSGTPGCSASLRIWVL